MQKNILITGASGFIGKHLLESIQKSNYKIYALTRNGLDKKYENVEILLGDLFSIEKYKNVLNNLDYIIYIAGEKKNNKEFFKINVEGFQYFLNNITIKDYTKIIYISSGGVYGIESQKCKIINEETNCLPNTDYEISKLSAEKLLQQFSSNKSLKYTILRPTNIFGEKDKSFKLLNLFNNIKKNKFFYLNKKATLNYLYVKQLTEVIVLILEKDIFDNEIYNINSSMNIVSFIEYCKTELNVDLKTKTINKLIVPLFYLLALILEFMPSKYHFFTIGKFRELTSEKYYSTIKINKKLEINEEKYIKQGLTNLINYYKKIDKLK